MRKTYLFLVFILWACILSAQLHHRVVTGYVIDHNNDEPLPGVSIQVLGTTDGVVTDLEGRFHLQTFEGQMLQFSFLGYKTQEIIVSKLQAPLLVRMESEAFQMAEVVVVAAMGLARPSREIGGGAQVVSNRDLNQGKGVDPLTGLTARVSGLRINMYDSKVDPNVKVVMRGTRSLSGNNEPLFVVDGVPVPEISRLNPNDIEDITVLKGANAAALYGSEGVNGALMIRTRRGERGRGRIHFSHTTGFSQVYQLPEAQNKFGQGSGGVYSPTEFQSWGPAFDGTMKPLGGLLPDGSQLEVLYAAPQNDVRRELFQIASRVQNNLSFSGGDQNSLYYLSLQHIQAQGIIPGDESQRTGARFNGSRKFGKLTSAYTLQYAFTQNNTTPDGPWVSLYQMPANFPLEQMKNWQDINAPGNPHNFFTDRNSNPYFQIDNQRNKLDHQMLNSSVQFDYPLSSFVDVTYRAGLYNSLQETRNTVGKFQATGRRNVNGSVSDGFANFRRVNSDVLLTLKYQQGNINTRLVLGNNLRADDTKQTAIGSSNLLLPELYNPGSRVGELNGSAAITQYRQVAVYGEGLVAYNNLLFLTLTGRNEWVSVLSKQNRSYFYPGVSTSFVFSEAFDGLDDLVSFGKVFASYNKTGNVNLRPYALNNFYTQSLGFPYGNLVGFLPSSTYPNPDIEPEFVTSFEMGTQLSFWDHRLHLEASYVYSDSRGQIFNATTSSATGYNRAVVNAGRLTNNIVELNLAGDVIRKTNLRWNMAFNLSHIRNEVKELFEGLETFSIFRQSYATVGKPYPSLHVADYARDSQGRVIVDATTGHPLPASELTYLGTMVPPWQMGLGSQITWKNLTLAMHFDCRLGGWMYSEVANRMIQNGTHPMTVEYGRQPFVFPNSVIEVSPGVFEPNTSVLTQGGGDAAFWNNHVAQYHINFAAPGDFLKLRELAITFNIPRNWLSNTSFIRNASVGVLANNVFLITHKDNDLGDPEYLYNNTDGYYSWRQVPPYRTLSFNVNVSF
ncbi:MAG: SusC/RagA family TonB-linked outer membrane protein [Bacteroidales bacterium]